MNNLRDNLSVEIEDVLFAVRQGDVRWVRRFLERWPALAQCRDAQGKRLLQHAEESQHPEIQRLFKAGGKTDSA